jgi:6-phosphogluconolactonase
MKIKHILVTGLLISAFSIVSAQTNHNVFAYVGTYTEKMSWVKGQGEGIYLFAFDTVRGNLSQIDVNTGIVNPSYLIIHPNGKWLFAVNETEGDAQNPNGCISAFRIVPDTHKLEFINKVSSQGTSPCHLSLDKTGKYLMTANYGNGSIAMFPIGQDGALQEASSVDFHIGHGPTPEQNCAHAHSIIPSADNRFAFCNDLGNDQIITYRLDLKNKKLLLSGESFTAEAGSGPRHLALHPNNRWAYSLNELKGTINVLRVNVNTGKLSQIQLISAIEKGKTGKPASAEIVISPNGRFLYASNRAANNNIAIFRINRKTGKLTFLSHQATMGQTPRFFTFDPTGRFLLVANQDSGNILIFKANQNTGLLEQIGKEAKIQAPVCIKFLP